MRYICYSLPSIQAFTSMLNITAVNTELVFSIVNFTVVAFTVAGNSSSLFGENGSSRLIINYNTKCKNILNDYSIQHEKIRRH
jgi:hypothetical protein